MESKPQRSLGRIALIVIMAIAALLALPYIAMPIYNNAVAVQYLRQLKEYPVPESVELVDSFWEVGKFTGNGNNTEYFAAIIIRSDLNDEALRDYYEAANFAPARSSHSSHQLYIGRVEDGRLVFEVDFHSIYNTFDLPEDESGYFCIALYDGGYPALFDIRGH